MAKPKEKPAPVCPFTGLPFDMRTLGTRGCFARVASPDGSYFTSVFPDLASLLVFLSRRAALPRGTKIPAVAPLSVCPFTGKLFDIVGNAVSGWSARVEAPEGGYQTDVFDERSELDYFLSTRGGVAPAFQKRPVIFVRDREPPQADPLADMKEKVRDLNEAAEHVVDSTLSRLVRM